MNFKAMPTDQLHALEFKVYESLPTNDLRELFEIWGVETTKEYYKERGRRLDLNEAVRIKIQIMELQRHLKEATLRLEEGTSGQWHFGNTPGVQW